MNNERNLIWSLVLKLYDYLVIDEKSEPSMYLVRGIEDHKMVLFYNRYPVHIHWDNDVSRHDVRSGIVVGPGILRVYARGKGKGIFIDFEERFNF